MDQTKGGKGFFRQILAAATLLLFASQTCSVPVPPGLTLQIVTEAKCPNDTYHKCLPYGDCYSFDEFCEDQSRSVQPCFPGGILRDEEKKLAWCLQLQKGEVELLNEACRFACEFTFSELMKDKGCEETSSVTANTVDQPPCQCEACRSSCDYGAKQQQQFCECSTPPPIVNCECPSSDTNWKHRYKWIIGILATLFCVSVALNFASCYFNWKLYQQQSVPEAKPVQLLGYSDSSLESDRTGAEDNTTSLVTLRRINSAERITTSCSCNALSACARRVLE